jgi:murein L,D-transpeptidase YcbB/YkuD
MFGVAAATASKGLFRWLAVVALLIVAVGPAATADNDAVARELAAIFEPGPVDIGSAPVNARLADLQGFYRIREFKPIWTRDTGPKVKAAALLAELKRSVANGLSPDFYDVTEIEALMPSRRPADMARLELLLSAGLIEFGEDLRNGRIGPEQAGSENAVEPVAVDPVALIEGAEKADDLSAFTTGLLDADFRYIRLIAKLAEFSRIQASDQWPKVDGDGAPIAAGTRDDRVQDIRRLLALSGDLDLSVMDGGAVLDDTVAAALRLYQARHGLVVSGAADAETLRSLATPLPAIIRQIKLNLERRRWQNRDLGSDYVYINLADASLKLVRDGKSSEDIAVRNVEQLRSVPSFFGAITGLEIDASLPGGVRLTVQSQHIDALGAEAGPATVAIADPQALARLVAEAAGENGSLQGGAMPMASVFDKPILLYVTYVTAWANGDGSIEFRPDIFARDGNLANLLELK